MDENLHRLNSINYIIETYAYNPNNPNVREPSSRQTVINNVRQPEGSSGFQSGFQLILEEIIADL